MTEIKKFTLKDVRCFEGRQEFNIRPLTFLVGENSTGKSTVLGCMQVLGDFVGGYASFAGRQTFFDFNAEPYKMGAFADIARNAGNRAGGRKERFGLGFELQIGAVLAGFFVEMTERGNGSEPSVEQVEIEFDEGLVVVVVDMPEDAESSFPTVAVTVEQMERDSVTKPVYKFKMPVSELWLPRLWVLLDFYGVRSKKENSKEFSAFVESINRRASGRGDGDSRPSTFFTGPGFPPYADLRFASFAPIRSKPLRTYDPERESEDPEGIGVPMTMINMHRKGKEWKNLRAQLVKFGEDSGLFTDINVKPLGRSVNNPFQIQVKVRGPKANIIDVGYGISQILPVLVRVFTAQQKTTFLVQQPEVHLHPKGQAELCSLFVDVAKQRNHFFVIETHSDYMINRARIEIMNGKISPEDVSLIYLEPSNGKVKVHNITFDKNANFDPPKSYGEFFLRESNRMLGFED